MEDFSDPELARLKEFCLSFSRFSEPEWKYKAVKIAETMKGENPLLSARISLRRRELCRLFPMGVTEIPHSAENNISPNDAASNTFLGEKLLLEVKHLMNNDKLSAAWAKLDVWQPMDHLQPSTLERTVVLSQQLLRGVICHFSGHFDKARAIFVELEREMRSKVIHPYVFSHLVAVECELGRIERAQFVLDELCTGVRPRRLKLAMAEIHLMEGLWAFRLKNDSKVQALLYSAKTTFQELQEGYQPLSFDSRTSSANHFSVLAGLAMIAHLECEISDIDGQLEDKLKAALSGWESAWCKAEECQEKFGWVPNFTQTMIHYAKSHIMLRQNSPAMLTHLMAAIEGYHRTGLQTYWTGLGTIFYDILGDLVVRDGGSRLPKRPEGDPSKNGFPFVSGSTRTTWISR
jgi:hypothetical protein